MLKISIFLACFLITPGRLFSQDYCFEDAGKEFGVAPALLRAISTAEWNPNESLVNPNANGTYDFCHMQINSSWAEVLGSEAWSALGDPCYCTRVGAWILSRCITRHGYSWEAVGCYHSENKSKKVGYAWKVHRILNKLKGGEGMP